MDQTPHCFFQSSSTHTHISYNYLYINNIDKTVLYTGQRVSKVDVVRDAQKNDQHTLHTIFINTYTH